MRVKDHLMWILLSMLETGSICGLTHLSFAAADCLMSTSSNTQLDMYDQRDDMEDASGMVDGRHSTPKTRPFKFSTTPPKRRDAKDATSMLTNYHCSNQHYHWIYITVNFNLHVLIGRNYTVLSPREGLG